MAVMDTMRTALDYVDDHHLRVAEGFVDAS